jgi:ParB/RepB/Spo0J family partition protein
MSEEILVPIDDIYPNPYQERQSEDDAAVMELAENILHNATDDFDGLMQIPTVRRNGKGYELTFGHTRHAAFGYLLAMGHRRYASMRVIVRELTDLQMFELGVGENMKRRNLNPMEEAHAIHTYMTEFNKTSVEAGAFFHKSPEAVRGAIRLLKLPEKAQEKVRAGELTVTAARALLTAEKIGGEEAVEDIMERLEQGDAYKSIEEHFKYRSGARQLNGTGWWELNPFPPTHLKHVHRKAVEAVVFATGGDEGEAAAIQQVADVDQVMMYLNSGMDVSYEAFPNIHPDAIEKIRILANPPACEKCPLHVVMGGNHWCGFAKCAERKADAWSRQEVESVSERMGIPVYRNDDGHKEELNPYTNAHVKLVQDRHADLRLVAARRVWNNFDEIGTDSVAIVAVGDLAAKMKKKSAAAEKESGGTQTPYRDWELERALGELSRDAAERWAWEVGALAFARAFDGITNEIVLERLSELLEEGHPDYVEAPSKTAKKAERLTFHRQFLAYNVLYRIASLGYSEPPSIKHMAKLCAKKAPDLGIKLPKDWDAQTDVIQQEYDANKKDIIEKRKAEKAK